MNDVSGPIDALASDLRGDYGTGYGVIGSKPTKPPSADSLRTLPRDFQRAMRIAGHDGPLPRGFAGKSWRDIYQRLVGLETDDNSIGESILVKPQPVDAPDLMSLFAANLRGLSMINSQFGVRYTSYQLAIEPAVEEATGTERVKAALLSQARKELKPFAEMVAVWRTWPQIDRDKSTGALTLYARFHLLTPEALAVYRQ